MTRQIYCTFYKWTNKFLRSNLGGPIIGIIATNISVSMGIACTSLLVTPVLVLYIVAMIMDKKVVDKVGGIDYEENN